MPFLQNELSTSKRSHFNWLKHSAKVNISYIRLLSLEPFQGYVQSLANLSHAQILPVSDGLAHMSDSPFREIVERHLTHNASGYHLLTYLNYRGPEFRQTAFIEALHGIDPLSRATSVDLVSEQLTESVRHSFVWALIIGGAIVFLLLVSHFNDPVEVWPDDTPDKKVTHR